MTGSINQFNRQHSSTTGSSTMEKIYHSKLRRCSSADDHNSMELIPDDNQHKEIFVFKREHTTSDVDSGTEEIEQQLEQAYITTFNDNEDKLSIASFSPNPDEGFSECEVFFFLCHHDSTKICNDVILKAFFVSIFQWNLLKPFWMIQKKIFVLIHVQHFMVNLHDLFQFHCHYITIFVIIFLLKKNLIVNYIRV